MKFSAACNWDPALPEQLGREAPSVDTVFGQITDDPLGGGRGSFMSPKCSRAQAEEFIAAARKRGFHFNYLLNGACLDNLELTRGGNRAIFSHIEWVASTGADMVTVTLPILLVWIKRHFPQLKVSVSSWARVANVKRAKYWEDLGADEIILAESATRDFAALRAMRRALRCKLEVIANPSCLYLCYLDTNHINMMSHSAQGGHVSGGFVIDHCQSLCQRMKLEKPDELIKARWIRPEDVGDYEEIGIDSLKLLERSRTTETLMQVVSAYEKRRFDGNFVELLTLPNRKAYNPPDMGYLMRPDLMNVEMAIQMADAFFYSFSDVMRIDNRALDGFAAHFKTHDCYHSSCDECGYCKRWADKAVRVDEEKRRAILAKFDAFTEAVVSLRTIGENALPEIGGVRRGPEAGPALNGSMAAAGAAARTAAKEKKTSGPDESIGAREIVIALWCMSFLIKKIFNRRIFLTAISLLPLVIFLNVARHYGFTGDAWMRAFVTGAAVSTVLMGVFAARRVPFRDILLALGLLFVSGAIAFLADIGPVLAVYRKFQGSVFLVWYMLVRAVLYFAPGLLSGFVFDPYERTPKLAAALTAGIFVWSLFFKDVLVSTVLPVSLMMILLSRVERDPFTEGG